MIHYGETAPACRTDEGTRIYVNDRLMVDCPACMAIMNQFPSPKSPRGQSAVVPPPVPALTLREYLVGKALVGCSIMRVDNPEVMATFAVRLADAVIAELKNERKPE